MSKKILEVECLKTYFYTFKGVVKAVDGIDFYLKKGEILGIVGESGGGKSITGFSIIKLIEEPGEIIEGKIIFDNKDLISLSEREMQKIRGKDIAMIFQDPMTSLNPVYTIQKQIEEVLILHTELNSNQRKKRCIELLRSVGIPNAKNRLKNYPHQFSGGMRQRVIIAIALAAEPKLIIADEPTTALDVTIQSQVLNLLKDLVKKNNCSLILISHDLAVVSEITDRVNVMYCGKIVESGETRNIINQPNHPYTKGLLSSIPKFKSHKKKLQAIPGIVPNMFHLPEGCNFSPRCAYRHDKCLKIEPEYRQLESKKYVSCHYPLQGGRDYE